MNPDSRNFDSLRRLLALKRHEQPPPGYFDRFSRDVMARIKAGENGVSFELPFIQRLFALFDVKPVFAGAFGMAMCALLISGVIASETDKSTPSPNGPAVAEGNTPVVNPDVNPAQPSPDKYFVDSSTNGLSLFDQLAPAQARPIAFRQWVPNGN